MTLLVVAAAVLSTAFLSGVLGMVGGMILMAIYLAMFPFEWAMALHGGTQLASNGFRAFLFRREIRWRSLSPYFVGAGVVFAGLFCFPVRLAPAYAYLFLGAVPYTAWLLDRSLKLDFARRSHASGCGMLVTAAHLTAGVSGPLLDVFFVRSPLSRQEVIGTKAITQTAGHIGKVGVFLPLIAFSEPVEPVSIWVWPIAMICAFVGTRLGRACVERWSDRRFRQVTKIAVLSIGALCLVRGWIGLQE